MSLNKSIEHGKEYRKQYRGAKAVDKRRCNSMKYKVGDRVRIRKDLEYGQLYGGGLFFEQNLVGEIACITYML